MSSDNQNFDIVICGGSFVGLALARALIVAAPGLYRLAIVEQKPLLEARHGAFDGRSAAITASIKAMLDVLGVWRRMEGHAEPVRSIHITDSALEAPIRPALIEMNASDTPSEQPTAYIVENALLRQALFEGVSDCPDVTWFAPDEIEIFTIQQSAVFGHTKSGKRFEASLLIAADGQNSRLRTLAGIKTTAWKSDRVGIVATVGIEHSHEGIARQHFLPAGPFAILPITGHRVSIVWTEEAVKAKRLLDDETDIILDELSYRFGPELGKLNLLSKPAGYPLTMTLARQFVKPRFALVGDAAHGLHWIAGQGLNHGMKDVAALAQTLIETSRLGLDIGSLQILQRYEQWRRFDSTTSAFAASALNMLFSNDNLALRMFRSSGLRVVDRLRPLKTFFMQEAAGLTGTLPKLLKGEPI